MKPILINAKTLQEEEIVTLRKEVSLIKKKLDRAPKLVIVKATGEKACEAYIRNKVKLGEEIGIDVEVVDFPYGTPENEIASSLMIIDNQEKVDSVILQLPVYDYLNKDNLIPFISSEKDGDCFSRENLGKILQNEDGVLPCTPAGVIDILKHHSVKIEGARVTIVGRSTHVGLTLGMLLTQMGAIVRITHSKTHSLEEDVRGADIVISCVGKKKLIQPEWMKKGSVLLGVGIVFEDGKQYTDYDINEMLLKSQCSLVGDRIICTGTATVINLMKNTIKLCKEKQKSVETKLIRKSKVSLGILNREK